MRRSMPQAGGRRSPGRAARRYHGRMLLLLAACQRPEPDPSPRHPTGEGLFTAGCPEAGRATARTLTEIGEAPEGPDTLAAPGDVVLFNEHAAFVIQAPDDPRTYYHYGGLPIDAVAVEDCAQTGPDLLGELGLIVGQLDLADFTSSTLHMVRGDTLTVVNDGSDGEAAVVEVTGGDDRFWLIELTLIRQVYEGGGRKELGDLYDLGLTLRYTLEPDSAALEVEVLLGGEPVTDGFLVGALLFPSDYTTETSWSNQTTSVGGIGLNAGIPWVADARRDGQGATALAMPGATMARTTIAGVTVLLDLDQAGEPLEVGDSASFLLSVAPTDAAAAAAALEDGLGDPIPAVETTWADLAGTVTDPDGTPVAGATVEVSAADSDGTDAVLTTLTTDADGRFSGRTLNLGSPWSVRAVQDGRDDGDPVDVDAGGEAALSIGRRGAVRVDAVDDAGAAMAVRVELTRDDGAWTYGYASPQDPTLDVPPGTWTAVVTRGYEFDPITTSVTVPDDGEGSLSVTLPHLLDTSGWASVDTHVHAGPSPDADELPVDRALTAAASGLDAWVSTDHEAIVDLAYTGADAGLDIVYGLGSEVTAVIPEHTNAWPFPTSDGARGDPVRWYQMGFPDIYAAERDRGAQVVQLNHSRVNGECGILCILDWDRRSEPATSDPEALGLAAGTEIWSWDFDSFELLNGNRSPYFTDDTRRSGALYDWMAFFTLGHRVAAMGVTDVHGDGTPGTPRTFVQVPDDADFTIDELAAGVLAGATQVSAGAFARLTVDGAGPGETVSVTDGEAEVAVHVEALPGIDVTDVDVLVDCDAWETVPADDPDGIVKLDTTLTLPVTGDHFVVLIARGEGDMPTGIEGYSGPEVPRVVVSPVLVDGDGDGVWTAPGAKECGWRPEG